MKTCFVVIFVFITRSAFAQTILEPQGAKAWGLGGASVTQSDVFSVSNNMAASNEIKTLQLGIYNKLPFGVKELNTINTSIILPSKFFHFGFAARHFGYDKFNQQCVDFGISKKLNKHFNLGVTFNYLAINITNQENTRAFTGSVSAFYKATNQLQFGVLFFNPIQSKYDVNGYGIVPTIARAGMKYNINNKVYFMLDMDKTLQTESIIRTGLNYALHPNFECSIGYANNPNHICFGFNAKYKQLAIAFSSNIQPTLGYTPHLSLVFYGK